MLLHLLECKEVDGPPPDVWSLKINCDASFYSKVKLLGIGMVCSNHEGKLLDGLDFSINSSSILQGKALTCMEALRTASRYSPSSIAIEFDAALVLQSISYSDEHLD